MKIIAGEFKGRQVNVPKGSKIRPATGVILEKAMNLYTHDRLVSGPFLDICAGSGLVGFEALSRGATRVIFVETDPRTAAALKRTASEFGAEDRVKVIKADARRCFSVVRKTLGDEKAACMFLDPPYIVGMAEDLLLKTAPNSDILKVDGLAIIRTPDKLPTKVQGFDFIEKRETNRSTLWLYGPEPSSGD